MVRKAMLPILRTKRSILNGFTMTDAGNVQKMAGDKNVSKTTLNIPHPYEDGMAEKWIAHHLSCYLDGTGLSLAIRNKKGKLLGCISLGINKTLRNAELGYWIGFRHWGKGYCTEAARAIIRYAFKDLKLNKITAYHLAINPASGRVMQKCGMVQVGLKREHVPKDGKYLDVCEYEILRKDFKVRGR